MFRDAVRFHLGPHGFRGAKNAAAYRQACLDAYNLVRDEMIPSRDNAVHAVPNTKCAFKPTCVTLLTYPEKKTLYLRCPGCQHSFTSLDLPVAFGHRRG
jgi:hypothetical protein